MCFTAPVAPNKLQSNSYHQMEEAKKVRVKGWGRDRISCLPNDVLVNVLCFLPVGDAVRTSILSRTWRHHWETLPRLVFDRQCGLSARKILLAIKRILSSHSGPITKFTLTIRRLNICDEIMYELSRKHVQDLTLSMCNLPSSLFSCAGLIHLDLTLCAFKLPPLFRGFKMLVTLKLACVDLDSDFLDIFIPSCPLLKELSLLHCNGVSHFNIEAPTLQMFHLQCEENFDSICFKNTPLLASVSIYYQLEHVYDIDNRVFGISLSALEQLYADHIFLQSIVAAVGNVPPRLPTLLPHLTVLDVTNVRFGAMGDVSSLPYLFCMIRSSPNLRKLNIEVEPTDYVGNPVQDLLGAEDYIDISFDQLHEASFYDVGKHLEIDFIGFILAKASNLRALYVHPSVTTTMAERFEILGKLNRFQRASSQVQVICVETEVIKTGPVRPVIPVQPPF